MLGASIGMAVCYASLTVCYLVQAQRWLPIAYETRRALTLIALIVTYVLGASHLPVLSWPATMALEALHAASFLAVAFLLRALEPKTLVALSAPLLRRFSLGEPAPLKDPLP